MNALPSLPVLEFRPLAFGEPLRPPRPPREKRWEYAAVLLEELQTAGFDPLAVMGEAVREAPKPRAWPDLVAYVRRLGEIRLPHHLVPDFEDYLNELLLEAKPAAVTTERVQACLEAAQKIAGGLDVLRGMLKTTHIAAIENGAEFATALEVALENVDFARQAMGMALKQPE